MTIMNTRQYLLRRGNSIKKNVSILLLPPNSEYPLPVSQMLRTDSIRIAERQINGAKKREKSIIMVPVGLIWSHYFSLRSQTA